MTARKVSFHPYRRWCAVAVDGHAVGYIKYDIKPDRATLHLKKNPPVWLAAVESLGPWPTIGACQSEIKNAIPEVI